MDGLAAHLTPLAGGFSGETFLAEVGGERTVVRVYGGRGARRGPEAPEVDAAVMALVRGLVPVPPVLEVRRADPAAGVPGLLVTAFVPGEPLDRMLLRLGDADRAVVGRRCGEVAARLACMPMPARGELADARLALRPLPPQLADLPAWVSWHLDRGAFGDWAAADRAALLRLSEHDQALLDPVTRSSLVHSDLNPKNVLVDPATLEVAAVVDWEFAHAGSPLSDLGNLLRSGAGPAFDEAALAAYQALVPDAPEDRGLVRARARAADLAALVELAARAEPSPPSLEARRLLLDRLRHRGLA